MACLADAMGRPAGPGGEGPGPLSSRLGPACPRFNYSSSFLSFAAADRRRRRREFVILAFFQTGDWRRGGRSIERNEGRRRWNSIFTPILSRTTRRIADLLCHLQTRNMGPSLIA